jgi:DHA2 family multidrug resistance protein
MLTLMRNVASSIGISVVIAKLTSGGRESYAILNEHVTPFNQAMQMPDVAGILNMNTDSGRAIMDVLIGTQAQIIAFAHDYQMVMIVTLCAIPLAMMIGSTKAALRQQSQSSDHAAVMD